MPAVAGGAPGTPPDGPPYAPAHPFPPPKKSFKKLCNLETFFFQDLVWLYLWLFFLSSLAPLIEVIIFLLFEPLGVDLELSS